MNAHLKNEDSSGSIRAALDRILASAGFAESDRLKRFLRFTVEQTLRGQSDRIKEYVIALEVFDRGESFDARIDPIVRVQAGKLRARLEKYYATEGREDPLRIEYPKGGYVPVFRERELTVPADLGEKPKSRVGWKTLALGGAGVSVVLLVILWVASAWRLLPPQTVQVPSIAVLPFMDMSPGKDQEFFCDGITEELINALAKIDGLRVVARTSAFQFKGQGQDIRKIGEELNVANVLEGSVRKSGNRLRVTAQLNSVADGYHLWSESYDREVQDVFSIQEEISRAIVETLKVKLSLDRSRPLLKQYNQDLETYNLYLRGRQQFNTPNPEGHRTAIAYFEQALARAPRYAPAHAGLAEAYYRLALRSGMPPVEAIPKARQAAQEALKLDETLGEAHSALAAILSAYDWERDAADKEFQRALELNPNSATVHHAYALHLLPTGRRDDALREVRRAQELDPLSSIIGRDMARTYIERREFDRAVEECQKILRRDPTFYLAHVALGTALAGKRSYKQAIPALERAISLSNREAQGMGALAYAQGAAGSRSEARKLLEELLSRSNPAYASPINVAIAYAGLGDKENFFAWLDKACVERSLQVNVVPGDYRFDSYRSDPRFVLFLKKIGVKS